MRLFPHSVRNYLLLTMLALSVPGLALLTFEAWQAAADLRLQSRLAELTKADRSLLLTANKIRSNRGQLQTAIQADDDAASTIAKVHESNKAEIETALQRLAAVGLDGGDALLGAIRQAHGRAESEKPTLQSEAAKPKAARSLAPTMPWYNAIGEAETALTKASDTVSNAIRLADPVLADYQALKQSAYRARASYGLQCTVLRPILASGQAMTGAQQRALGETRGATAAAVGQVRSLASRPGLPASLVARSEAMVAAIDAGTRGADDLISKLGAGAGPIVSAEQWTRQCNAPFAAVIQTVEAALDEMEGFSQSQFASAGLRLAVVGGLVLGLLGLALYSWLGIKRRISSPLSAMSGALAVMQAGDFSRPIPKAPCPDEVGSLSVALEHYRENALALNADRTARDKAIAAESEGAAKVQALVAQVAGVVAAARRGDFSGHVDAGGVTGAIREVVEGVNEINGLVDSATRDFAAVLTSLAEGDLTQQVTTDYEGRFAELKDALNLTVERLSETVSTIQQTAVEVSTAAREINAGANDLSSRTEQQASSLEETAATTEELAASVKASAASSRLAVDLTQDATVVAETGGSIVRDAIHAMAAIEQASQKITDITSVIDEIAFQTNLLALNAAVEAARAGEAGKGFAVVASEVRTLAQRSSAAAKDITALIGASEAEVAKGVGLVRSAGDALEKIVLASRKVSHTVTEVSAAAGEQANGIDEMSQAVAHMDEMTQQNAALAEESAASAASLSNQIERLNELVGTFRTRARSRLAPSAVAEPPVATEPARLRQLAASAFGKMAAAGGRSKAGRAPSGSGWEAF